MVTTKQYLKITKHDKTVHFGESSSKRKLEFQNTLRKPEERYKLELVEMTEKEVANHPGYDESYSPVKTPANNAELTVLKKQLESSSGENTELKKKIEEMEEQLKANGTGSAQVNASNVIAMIQDAETPGEVDEIIGDDTRVSVMKAANKKKEELGKTGL